MSLIRQTFQSNPTGVARLLLAVALVCALLVTQFGLSRHVIEHAAQHTTTIAAANTVLIDDSNSGPDAPTCLTCLEHQAHGASMASATFAFAALPIKSFEHTALAPNTPYLAPERASQRAPPVLS